MQTIKNKFSLLAVAVTLAMSMLLPTPSRAQDLYGKATLLALQTNLIVTATGSNTTPVDVHGLGGVAEIQINFQNLNVGGSGSPTTVLNIYGSQTGTNGWAILQNVAFSTNKAVIGTNFLSGVLSTNQTYTQGTAFTNAATWSFTTGSTNLEAGVSIDDAPRYLNLQWTITGTLPTNQFGVTIHARGEVN